MREGSQFLILSFRDALLVVKQYKVFQSFLTRHSESHELKLMPSLSRGRE